MKTRVPLLGLILALGIAGAAQGHEIKRLTSLAPTVLLAQTKSLGVVINDGVTDGCMKWPTGVLRSAQGALEAKGIYAEDAPRNLQINASGYKQAGADNCYVNVDLILDDLADIYLNNGAQDYAAFVRFDIWRTSFMISGARDSMQNDIQSRVGQAVEELVNDIERSKTILRENDADFYDDFILMNVD
jgi:hypothetical protein